LEALSSHLLVLVYGVEAECHLLVLVYGVEAEWHLKQLYHNPGFCQSNF
jgi:hypothetical protein